MSIDKNHSEQFERYLKGQMSPQEAHAFEREVLDDPFSQEALEGFEEQGRGTLDDLERLKTKVSTSRKKVFPFMKIAAAIALLLVATFTVYIFTNQVNEDLLAMEEEPMEEIGQSSSSPDTVSIPTVEKTEDPTSAKPTQPGVSKKDELKEKEADDAATGNQLAVTDKEEESADEMISEMTLAEVSDVESTENVVDNDAADLLQGRAAGVQIAEIKSVPNPVLVDTAVLDEVVITAQPLVANKEAISYSVTEIEESEKQKAKRAAVARSRSIAGDVVSGTVSDDTGEPLPGVNVVIKGTTTGVTTDIDGTYQLPKTDEMTLAYSFVGFESQEIEVGDRSTINVTMGGAMELQEVVVTGYDIEERGSPKLFIHASPEDGFRNYKKYLEENLRYPEAAEQNEIEGTVVLELTINARGEIDQVDIKKSLGYGCDEEAIRLTKNGPKWRSAKADGNKVEDKVRVRVKFKLD